MIAALKWLWSWFSGSTVGKYLIEGLVLIGTLGAVYAKIHYDGKRAGEIEVAAADAEAAQHAAQASNDEQAAASKMTPDETAKELDKWQRG